MWVLSMSIPFMNFSCLLRSSRMVSRSCLSSGIFDIWFYKFSFFSGVITASSIIFLIILVKETFSAFLFSIEYSTWRSVSCVFVFYNYLFHFIFSFFLSLCIFTPFLLFLQFLYVFLFFCKLFLVLYPLSIPVLFLLYSVVPYLFPYLFPLTPFLGFLLNLSLIL